MKELYELLNEGAYFYAHSLERNLWHHGDIGKTHLPDLPRGQYVEYDPYCNYKYKKEITKSKRQFNKIRRALHVMEKYIPLLVLTTLFSCTNASKYYTMDDYAKVDKIDTHIHVSADRDIFVKKARNDNFQLLNILVDNTRGREDIRARYAKKKPSKKNINKILNMPRPFRSKNGMSLTGHPRP